MRHRIDPLIILIAMVVAWSIAAAYRIAIQSPTGDNIYFNYGTMFLIPAFVGLDYVRIRFGIRLSMSIAVLAIVTNYVVNADAYSSDHLFAFVASCTALIAIIVGGAFQRLLKNYPIWEMAVITHVASNVAHSIFFHGVYRYNYDDFYKYIYVSISFKVIMFLFSIPMLIGGLKLTMERRTAMEGEWVDLNSPTRML